MKVARGTPPIMEPHGWTHQRWTWNDTTGSQPGRRTFESYLFAASGYHSEARQPRLSSPRFVSISQAEPSVCIFLSLLGLRLRLTLDGASDLLHRKDCANRVVCNKEFLISTRSRAIKTRSIDYPQGLDIALNHFRLTGPRFRRRPVRAGAA